MTSRRRVRARGLEQLLRQVGGLTGDYATPTAITVMRQRIFLAVIEDDYSDVGAALWRTVRPALRAELPTRSLSADDERRLVARLAEAPAITAWARDVFLNTAWVRTAAAHTLVTLTVPPDTSYPILIPGTRTPTHGGITLLPGPTWNVDTQSVEEYYKDVDAYVQASRQHARLAHGLVPVRRTELERDARALAAYQVGQRSVAALAKGPPLRSKQAVHDALKRFARAIHLPLRPA